MPRRPLREIEEHRHVERDHDPAIALSTKVGAHTPANERRRPRRSKEKPVSPGAERMRLYRDRRRDGLRCVTIEIRLTVERLG